MKKQILSILMTIIVSMIVSIDMNLRIHNVSYRWAFKPIITECKRKFKKTVKKLKIKTDGSKKDSFPYYLVKDIKGGK